MKAMLSTLLISAAVPLSALLTLGAAPAAHAATAHVTPQYTSNYPADCTFSVGTSYDSLTCTARPAQQQWKVVDVCIPWVHEVSYQGTVVPGDGTSDVTHCLGYLISVNFEVVSG